MGMVLRPTPSAVVTSGRQAVPKPERVHRRSYRPQDCHSPGSGERGILQHPHTVSRATLAPNRPGTPPERSPRVRETPTTLPWRSSMAQTRQNLRDHVGIVKRWILEVPDRRARPPAPLQNHGGAGVLLIPDDRTNPWSPIPNRTTNSDLHKSGAPSHQTNLHPATTSR